VLEHAGTRQDAGPACGHCAEQRVRTQPATPAAPHRYADDTLLCMRIATSDVGASVGQYKLRRLLRFDDLVAASGRELKLFEVSAKTGAGLGELESWMRATKAKRANKGKK